jgi:hypothetical protein
MTRYVPNQEDELHEQTQLLRSIRNMLTFLVVLGCLLIFLAILSAAATA